MNLMIVPRKLGKNRLLTQIGTEFAVIWLKMRGDLKFEVLVEEDYIDGSDHSDNVLVSKPYMERSADIDKDNPSLTEEASFRFPREI